MTFAETKLLETLGAECLQRRGWTPRLLFQRPGNVRAQVSATVDFSQREQTSEVYRPNETPGTAAIRSKQTSDSAQNGMLQQRSLGQAVFKIEPAPIGYGGRRFKHDRLFRCADGIQRARLKQIADF